MKAYHDYDEMLEDKEKKRTLEAENKAFRELLEEVLPFCDYWVEKVPEGYRPDRDFSFLDGVADLAANIRSVLGQEGQTLVFYDEAAPITEEAWDKLGKE